jgi:hypothetical protein
MMGGSVSNLFGLSVSGGTGNMLDASGTKSISKSGYGVGRSLHSANNTAANQRCPDDDPGDFAVSKQNKDQRHLGSSRGQETKPTIAYKKIVEPSSLKNLTDNAIIRSIDYEVQYHGFHEQSRASSSSHDMVSSHSDGWSSLHQSDLTEAR